MVSPDGNEATHEEALVSAKGRPGNEKPQDQHLAAISLPDVGGELLLEDQAREDGLDLLGADRVVPRCTNDLGREAREGHVEPVGSRRDGRLSSESSNPLLIPDEPEHDDHRDPEGQ